MKKNKIIIAFCCVAVLIIVGIVFWQSLDGSGVKYDIDIKKQITADNGVELDCHIYSTANMHHEFLNYDISLVSDENANVHIVIRDAADSVYDNPVNELKFVNTIDGVSQYNLGETKIFINNDDINTKGFTYEK